MIVGNAFMHSAERINPFPTDIPGLRDAINKKWNINSGPNGGKAPRMYVQDVKNNVPANNIPQKSPGVKEEVKATTPIAEKFAKRQISAGGVFSGAAYAETAREYRTEENAKEFDEAYTYGLAGESLNDFTPETDTVPLVKAWSAGRQDAKTNAELRNGKIVAKNENAGKVVEAERDANKSGKNKIYPGMSDSERTKIIANKKISLVKAKDTDISADDLAALENAIRGKAEPILVKLAEQFGVIKKYHNAEIDLDFNMSKSAIRESVHYQKGAYKTYAKMLSVFDDVVENAKGIEVHRDIYKETIREDRSLEYTYVLASAFYDGDSIIPVQMNIKVFKDKDNTIRMVVSFANKKEASDRGEGRNGINHSLPLATKASNISIADLVKLVNPEDGDFLKYFPDSMLTKEQIEGKKKALGKQQEKITRLKQGVRSEAEATKKTKASSTEASKDEGAPERWQTERMERTKGKEFSVKGLTEIFDKLRQKKSIGIFRCSFIVKGKPRDSRVVQ